MMQNPPSSFTRQKGLTLVELMVALVISLIVVLAAAAALLLSRQGFSQVDASSQLRENAKYAEALIQRLAVQTGYRDVIFAATPRYGNTSGMSTEKPSIYGFNNRERGADQKSYEASTSERTVGTPGYGSDILVLRFQSSAITDGSTKTDEAIIDCSGFAPKVAMNDRFERYSSVFHVAPSSDGEMALMCTRWPDSDDGGNADTQPLISGVENFQVLYGADGITAADTTFATADSVPDAYLRADQITVSDATIALQRWQRVRSIRIGMVLRGAPGTAIGDTNIEITPFGTDTSSQILASDVDPGTKYTPPNDGRLRQVVSFTIHLRNPQGDE